MAKPTEEQIRQRAQEIWEENHRPAGRDDEFWHQAEKELDEKELGDIAERTSADYLARLAGGQESQWHTLPTNKFASALISCGKSSAGPKAGTMSFGTWLNRI